jgi:hypothetical protein
MARIGLRILARDYDAFKLLMPGEERLRKSYSELVKHRLEEDSRPGTENVTAVTVYPEEFRLYCLQIGQQPSYSVLEAYAARKSGLEK